MKRLIRACAICSSLVVPTALAGAPADTQERTWNFRVYLNESEIGHHRFTLRGEGAARELTSEARFNIRVLGFSAYRYVHDAKERWRDGCLERLSARTDDNGERLAVTAEADRDRLAISSARGRTSFDGCVMTFAYWNPAMLRQARLLNAQTGEYEAVTVAAIGNETITVRGAQVNATRYRVTGSKHPIDLWYSPQHEWLALESTVDAGRRLRYRLL